MPKPTPRARALAEALRVARKAAKLAATEVADKLVWSQSTISRIETDLRAASAEEVPALLSLARDNGPWWFADLAVQRETLVQYGKETTKIVAFGTTLVPEPLRTPADARATNSSFAVLGRQVGGPRVMTNQLQHLIEVAERPTVELRVIPFAAGAYPGGDYVRLEFGPARPLVYLKHRGPGCSCTGAAMSHPTSSPLWTLSRWIPPGRCA
ncbi:Scr1 family TA system antitoxin-like transcriptional regulator [Amycolatopsis keratiniphila]|uniref:XRE family transcriptional regulator n=1 Tax=Amycolatopsis keratiniphila TaxID=129921 RepID=R4SWJ4_9PSEU|nr:Scr1 family TA system antitoxin-like transcriptional regulator [Amycolatopsis keratiniphila]AGM03122.1 XRE family transcriptional regulator [Amycolatopsis keratiniphila]